MGSNYIITFEKDPQHRRHLVTHVMTNLHRDIAVIDLCEETLTHPRGYSISPDGEVDSFPPESNLINMIHTTINIQPDQLPFIIQSLQNLYDNYKENKHNGG